MGTRVTKRWPNSDVIMDAEIPDGYELVTDGDILPGDLVCSWHDSKWCRVPQYELTHRRVPGVSALVRKTPEYII